MADTIAKMPVAVRIYQTAYTPKTDEIARQECLELAVADLLKMGAHRARDGVGGGESCRSSMT